MLISQHGDKHLDEKQRRRCEIITRLIANKISSSEASGFFCTRAARSNWQYQWESYIQKQGVALNSRDSNRP
jgi:hypothetical protein